MNFNQNFSWYRFHFIANEPIYLNFEFGLERELAAMEYHTSTPCHERNFAPKNCIKGESVTIFEWNQGECEGKWNRVWKAEIGRYITAYNREGRYISDVSPMLGVLKNEDINEFNYWQPNAYGLTVKLFFWNENKDYTPVGAEYLAGATRKFNLEYNDIFGSENPFEYDVSENTERIEIVTYFRSTRASKWRYSLRLL